MNKCELIVKKYLEKRGHKVKRIHYNKPDFLIDNKFYVEVKNFDSTNKEAYYLSRNQIIEFSKLKEPVFIYYVSEDVIVKVELFKAIYTKLGKTKTIHTTFEDKEHEQLLKKKGDKSWRQFILDLAGIKKGKKENDKVT